jgi:predicted PurR-regulated permease PerM
VTGETAGLQANDGWTSIGDQVAGTRDALTGRLDIRNRPATLATAVRQLFGLACGTAAIAALYLGRGVLIPITLAVMLSFILSPMVNFLQRLRIMRAPAVVMTVLAALSLVGAIGMLIGTQAASLSVNAPEYAHAIEAKVQLVQGMATQRMIAITKALGGGRKPKRSVPLVPTSILSGARNSASGSKSAVLVEMAEPRSTPMSVAKTILEPLVGPLETTFIVLMVAIFVLMQKEDLRDRFIRVFGSTDLRRTTMALDDAGKRLSRYFVAQLAVNTSFGFVIAVGLWLFGVPSPAMWGVMAGMLRFVPYIGPVLAAVAPVALGAAIDPGWSTAIFIALYFVIVEGVIGYIIEPLLYGHSTGLSPVSVIISAIFWTWLWGPVGLIISTPLTLCLVVLGRHVKALEFFDVILGDRPALTPVEGFYQRILANNVDEALAQAEAILGECSIQNYYDDVVISALRMAATDETKGTIENAHLDAIKRTTIGVVEELATQIEQASVTKSSVLASVPAAVACVSGGGAFDEVVAAMLKHVLECQGYRARLVTHEAAARGAIVNLDLAGIDTIVISYLELTGAPAQLRFLIRRLRQKAPNARIIVGLWLRDEPALDDSAVQTTIGADAYVSTLTAAAAAVDATALENGVDALSPGNRARQG